MARRIRFTKEALARLAPPNDGKRSVVYDAIVPKLAVRCTRNGTKTFCVIRRNGAAVLWEIIGRFPDVSVEGARKLAEGVLGDMARGINPAAKRREEKAKQTLGAAYEQYRLLHVEPRGVKSADEIKSLWQRFLGPLPDLPAKKHGRKREKHPAGIDWSRRALDAIENPEVRTLHAAIGRAHKVMANRVVELLSAIYNNATRHGYRGDNPASGIEPFREKKRDRFILPDELPRFFTALAADTSEDLKHFVLLCLLTGARRMNVLAMRWQELDLDSAVWRIPDTKNQEPLLVALVPEAVAILRTRKPQDAGYVFPATSKTGHITPPKKRWAALVKRAKVSDLRVHDLRRSLGSWQAISGASLAIIGKSLGHKSPDATAIYARLHLDPVRASLNVATTAMLAAAGVKTAKKRTKSKKKVVICA
jgi:integrase